MQNPYSLVFGKLPNNFIERDIEIGEILETFYEEDPSIRTYIITGQRGTGKTVTLSKIEKELRDNKEFIVLSLNSDIELLESASEELYYLMNKQNILKKLNMNFSFPGVNISIKDKRESANLRLDNLLDAATKHKKKILFCIDEVSNTTNIKSFCQAFNIWLRKDYNVLLLMTGLKKNILSLQGDDRVSFLKRAEKIELSSLSVVSIASNYIENLGVTDTVAAQMASLTKGYSYAFQVLGYLCHKTNKSYLDVLTEFDEKLTNNVYDIIWEDLTPKERLVLSIISKSDYSTSDITSSNDIDKNTYNEYRKILITKGILKDCGYGKIDIILPHFAEIINRQLKYNFWSIN